jgi:SAM-dependent methyltransferase
VTDPDERRRTIEFFGTRAATWDERFPDDGPKFEAAVAALRLAEGATAVDVGCGTGRALSYLKAAVGPAGVAIGLDLTPEMCAVAANRAPVVLADAAVLPLANGACYGLLAAGLLHHLADPLAGLHELARVTKPDGTLALFHPIGRVALAKRRGHDLSSDDIRDERNLPAALAATGWRLTSLDDGDDRYLAVARRTRTFS